MMAKDEAELKLLEPRFRGRVADEVFGEPYIGTAPAMTAILRKAVELLRPPAAPSRTANALPSGEPFTIEFLLDEPTV